MRRGYFGGADLNLLEKILITFVSAHIQRNECHLSFLMSGPVIQYLFCPRHRQNNPHPDNLPTDVAVHNMARPEAFVSRVVLLVNSVVRFLLPLTNLDEAARDDRSVITLTRFIGAK